MKRIVGGDVTDCLGSVEIRDFGGAEEFLLYPHPSLKWVGGVRTYLHADQLGSVRLQTNDNGEVAGRRAYAPFGEITNPGTLLADEDHGYIGERYDTAAELQYLNARYYDPLIPMFTQPDWFEVTMPGVGTNRYAYSFNDPINRMDPSGNRSLESMGPVERALNWVFGKIGETASAAMGGDDNVQNVITTITSITGLDTPHNVVTAIENGETVGVIAVEAAGVALGKVRALENVVDGIGNVIVRATRNTATKRGICSFHAGTLVLTDGGLLPISDVNTTMLVWSRNPMNGDMAWKSVQAQYSNPYDETVSVTMRDMEIGVEQTIVSNRIHPYFVQTMRFVEKSSEGHVYEGSLGNGHWIDASDLRVGDRLLNDDGTWSEVTGVEVEAEPLTAFNLTIADFHTYFVAANTDAAPVWVHNSCFDNLSDSLGNMGRTEFDGLAAKWGNGTFDSVADNLRHHAGIRWGGDIAGYLRASSNFSTRGAKSSGLRADGSILYTKNGQFAIFRDGAMVTFGRN